MCNELQPYHPWLQFYTILMPIRKKHNIYHSVKALQSFVTGQPHVHVIKKVYMGERKSKLLTFFSGSRAPEAATESSSSFSLFLFQKRKKKIKIREQ